LYAELVEHRLGVVHLVHAPVGVLDAAGLHAPGQRGIGLLEELRDLLAHERLLPGGAGGAQRLGDRRGDALPQHAAQQLALGGVARL
jgi:hypothetical protein